MTDRIFSECCYGSEQQHRADEPCPQDQTGIAQFFKLPMRFVEPLTDSDWPKVVDAEGMTVAHIFWPAHEGALDEGEAERATYALGRAFAEVAGEKALTPTTGKPKIWPPAALA